MKRLRILFCCFYFRAPIVICTLHTTLLNTSREEGTVAKVVLCRVEVSTATQTNRTAVPKSFFGLSEIWNKCKIVSMSVLTVMLVII